MKKISKIMGAVLSVVIGASTLTLFGCAPSSTADATTVMNLSVNPEVEFVLDANDKIVSVNAINEEGNLIISAEAFKNIEGKTAEEGAKIFLSVAVDTGFIIEGRVSDGENQVEISVSGEDAQELYNKVKGKAEEFFTSENITAKVEEFEAISKEKLEELLQEVKPYLTEAELKAKEYKDIVKELAEERKATAEIYSQEVKKAYYEAKAFALEQAELETLKGKLSELGKQAITMTNDAYVSLVEQLESTRYNLLVKEDGIYQKALTAFYKAKAEYVNYRNYVAGLEETEATTAILERLDSLKSIVDNTETALINAKDSADDTIDSLKDSLSKAHKAVIGAIETFSVKANDFMTEISEAKKEAIKKFTADFENEYKEINAKVLAKQEEIRKEFTKEAK